MQTAIVQHIKRFVNLSNSEIEILNKYIKFQSLGKRENILSNGQICKSMYFVESGCLRMFFLNSKSSEQITQFAIEGWWMTDYSSLIGNTPSEYFIQAIEKSEIVSIDTLLFEKLLKELPQLEHYFRIILQKNLAASQLRTKYLYEMSKEEFYLHFSKSFPDFMQRVPQYMVASYLGLTPEYLSELRKKN